MADVMVALDRADLPPEALDAAVRALADEGVDVLDVPREDEAEVRRRRGRGQAGVPPPATWCGSTCGKSAGCRC